MPILETAIANAVVENTKLTGEMYDLTYTKKGIFSFFTADNSNFDEDTLHGKGTTHGTIIAVYQKTTTDGHSLTIPLAEAKSLSVESYHVKYYKL